MLVNVPAAEHNVDWVVVFERSNISNVFEQEGKSLLTNSNLLEG